MLTEGGSTRPVRLLHTSDLHLGDKFDSESAKSREALLAILTTAHDLRVDALLMAGDIFDNARVTNADVAFFLDAVARSGVKVVALPGNHDSVETGSVYHRPIFRTLPSNLSILANPKGEGALLEEVDLFVWGRPTEEHTTEFRPLVYVPPIAPKRNGLKPWHVVMAHGHFMDKSENFTRASPIMPEDIAVARCDYIALGHWDRTADVSQAGVHAWYSGAPEMGPNTPGHVLIVDLVPGEGARVRPTRLFVST